MTGPRIAVVYYSATGTVHALAETHAHVAAETGAQVRVRRVAELAPDDVVDAQPARQSDDEGYVAAVHRAARWQGGRLAETARDLTRRPVASTASVAVGS